MLLQALHSVPFDSIFFRMNSLRISERLCLNKRPSLIEVKSKHQPSPSITDSKLAYDRCDISLAELKQILTHPFWGKVISRLPQGYHSKLFGVFKPSPFPVCLDSEVDMVSLAEHINKTLFEPIGFREGRLQSFLKVYSDSELDEVFP